ncbi:hypothetical protein, partial [Modestobacter versicolor]|uniref:hypothetical protein n=1 Tax=Modestobacter versicolor TaxID=429133 RepID=UPI0034DF7ACF
YYSFRRFIGDNQVEKFKSGSFLFERENVFRVCQCVEFCFCVEFDFFSHFGINLYFEFDGGALPVDWNLQPLFGFTLCYSMVTVRFSVVISATTPNFASNSTASFARDLVVNGTLDSPAVTMYTVIFFCMVTAL